MSETSVIVVGAAIVRDDTVLCARRSAPPRLAGKWEFPGGKVEAGESDAEAVVRECREELGVEVTVGARVGADARIDDRLTLRVFLAYLEPGQPEPSPLEDHDRLAWVRRGELLDLDWLSPDVPIVGELGLMPALNTASRSDSSTGGGGRRAGKPCRRL
ncbi:(deoxy)nucleoside triphosphate pyrophosphohydrolase [Catenulispora acidiphila]|uniref:(deoxy)nucleoside triphosphate pyrophosphohydrolase n=1 Tax=Catenulispora acidiphila TaxID=304895 RepID=UPI00019DF967|nr:(deoxy)nucleoside triphosphate pyrophosphohydrolase [Catenulispora acidiphila]